MLKPFPLLIFFILPLCAHAQNKHLSLGVKENGICFGNSADYNGIRLNLWDRKINEINGLNITGYARGKRLNGLSIGIIGVDDSIASNGIIAGGVFADIRQSNGIIIGGLGAVAHKINGVGLSGGYIAGDTLNGFFLGYFGHFFALFSGGRGPASDTITMKVINGVYYDFIGVFSERSMG